MILDYADIISLIESIEQAMYFKAVKFGMWAYHADAPRFMYESKN